MFTVTANITIAVPYKEAGPFLTALNASVPADVTPTSVNVSEATPSSVAGTFEMTGSITASMSETDIEGFLSAVMAAAPADATLQGGSLSFVPVVAA
jgi:hypothetical protein